VSACYVVLAPEASRGIYDTWDACQAAVLGVSGAVYRKAADRVLAAQLLAGEGRTLAPGTYAFVDGNHLGGIGVVLVHRRADGTVTTREVATTVAEVSPGLAADLSRLANPLAELVAVYAACWLVRGDTVLTIVHDYEGTSCFLDGRWTARDATMRVAVNWCKTAILEQRLRVSFRHTPGHQSAVGGDEVAAYNARADALATAAGRSLPPVASRLSKGNTS